MGLCVSRAPSNHRRQSVPQPFWMKNVACHINKQRMLQPSSRHITASTYMSPERTQARTRMPAVKPSATEAPPHKSTRRDSGWESMRHWPQRAEVHSSFSEPRLLHLSIYRKVLNSLTWDIWFSLIRSNHLIFQLPGLCCKNSCISWLLPCLFRAVPYSSLRGYVLGLWPRFCPLNKT